MEELRTQTPRVLNGQAPAPSAYPHQIAFNALPHIESFDENGYTREELKMLYETRKILHAPDLRVSATCVRVPVMVSHSEAVHVEFTHPISPDEVRDILSGFPGIAVVDGPEDAVYPMPVDAEGRDEVFVGRIRRDLSHPNGIAMWLVSDNLRKGAALNGVTDSRGDVEPRPADGPRSGARTTGRGGPRLNVSKEGRATPWSTSEGC